MLRIFIPAALVAIVAIPSTAIAGEIVLTSPDLTVSFKGEFIGFHRDHYIIKYSEHEIRVPAAKMLCTGDDCLSFETVAPPEVGNEGS